MSASKSTKKILDEFSTLPVSRQRKYQLRKAKARLCVECSSPLSDKSGEYCEAHRQHITVRKREAARKRKNSKLRRLDSESYNYQALNHTRNVN